MKKHNNVKLQDKSRVKYMLGQSFYPLRNDCVVEVLGYYIGFFADGTPCVVKADSANLIRL